MIRKRIHISPSEQNTLFYVGNKDKFVDAMITVNGIVSHVLNMNVGYVFGFTDLQHSYEARCETYNIDGSKDKIVRFYKCVSDI